MSTDLIAALRTALDERERLAKDAAAHCGSLIAREARRDDCYEHQPPYDGGAWSSDWDHVYAEDPRPGQPKLVPIADFGYSAWGLTGHIQTNSPAFALADIAAKRKLIERGGPFCTSGCDEPGGEPMDPETDWTTPLEHHLDCGAYEAAKIIAEAYGITATESE